MGLFGKKQWLIILISMIVGLILTALVLKLYFGKIEYWILIITGLIGIIITYIVGRHMNKK